MFRAFSQRETNLNLIYKIFQYSIEKDNQFFRFLLTFVLFRSFNVVDYAEKHSEEYKEKRTNNDEALIK